LKSPPDTAKKSAAVLLVGDESLIADFGRVTASRGYEVLSPKEVKNFKGMAPRTHIALELTNIDSAKKKERIEALDQCLPPTAAILTSSVNVTVLEQSTWVTMKHRLVGIGAFPTFINRDVVELAPSVHTLEPAVGVAVKFVESLKKQAVVVQDRVGMVMPRILCQIINEAMFAVQEGTASPKEIDVAMKIGAGYPLGPLEWGERIGFAQVVATLSAIHAYLGEERYRICPLLREIATTGKFWGDAET